LHSKDLAAERSTVDDPMHADHPLIVFAENFLSQFSAKWLGRNIDGFNERSYEQLVRERERLEERNSAEATILLVYQLEQFCQLMPELSYGNAEQDSIEFHYDHFPEFLECIISWLEVTEGTDRKLIEAAVEAIEVYREAIG
jgi:hypothetical protein